MNIRSVEERLIPQNGDLVRVYYQGRWHKGTLTEYDGYQQDGRVMFPDTYEAIPAYPDGTRGIWRNFGAMRPADGDFYLPFIPESHR
jgi:hypothetical protein